MTRHYRANISLSESETEMIAPPKSSVFFAGVSQQNTLGLIPESCVVGMLLMQF